MSKTQIDGKPVAPTPSNIPEELLPVIDWFQENGKSFLIQLVIILIVFFGAFAFKQHYANKTQAASASILAANDVPGLEELNGKFGNTKAGALIRLRLARAYYEFGDFDLSASAFKDFAKSKDKHALAPEARLGYAASLEAQQKFSEAIDAYNSVNASHGSPADFAANFGIARCTAANGDKSTALNSLDFLLAENKGTSWEPFIENEKIIIKRFNGLRPTKSLFDKMGSLGNTLAPSDAADLAADPVTEVVEEVAAEPAAGE